MSNRSHPLENASLLFLTTTGRRTGRPHRVEVSFVYEQGQVFLLAHARQAGRGTDWYRNLRANPKCVLEVPGHRYSGTAVFDADRSTAEQEARARFRDRYGAAAYERRYAHTDRLPVRVRVGDEVT